MNEEAVSVLGGDRVEGRAHRLDQSSHADMMRPAQPYCKVLLAGFPQHLEAPLGDDVVLVSPGVSRTRDPLDGALVLQFLDGIVVAEIVRVNAGASSRRFQGQVGSWRERL
jgi:hypothetical protein